MWEAWGVSVPNQNQSAVKCPAKNYSLCTVSFATWQAQKLKAANDIGNSFIWRSDQLWSAILSIMVYYAFAFLGLVTMGWKLILYLYPKSTGLFCLFAALCNCCNSFFVFEVRQTKLCTGVGCKNLFKKIMTHILSPGRHNDVIHKSALGLIGLFLISKIFIFDWMELKIGMGGGDTHHVLI